MNFRRNLVSIIVLLGSVFAFSGCTRAKGFKAFDFLPEIVDEHVDVVAEDNSYIKLGDYRSYPAINGSGNIVKLGSAYDVLTSYTGRHIVKATGDRKILVVPVEFSDFRAEENLGVSNEQYIENLNKAFFGSYFNNKFVSVSEYYNRSSYGKLRLSGTVCDKFYTFPKTVFEINSKKTNRDAVLDSYTKVINWYKDTYHLSLDEYRIDPEDSNSDVALYLVYCYPTDNDFNAQNPKFFWDYTFFDRPLSWSSYSSMNTISGEPDAHTFIHETGHLLGLNDYYPTEENEKNNLTPEPAGRIDMMDSSVGDHTGLSKMILDWVRPYHVQSFTEITISALAEKPDLILINNDWNGTVFDEYYLLEFYSPSGLNYYDSNVGNNLAKLPTLPGLKIYHVDARLGYFTSISDKTVRSNVEFDHYCDEFSSGASIDPSKISKNINFVHDNSTYQDAKDDEDYKKHYLYELELNHVGHSLSACATNFNLYHKGDVFEINADSWNKLNNTKYKLSIEKLTYRDTTIKIEKL